MNAHDPNPPNGEPWGAEGVDTGHDARVPQITLITKRDVPSLMSKRIYLDATGKLHSDGSECRMGTGTAARAFAGTASDLARIIQSCGSDQAIALGALKEDIGGPVAVTTKGPPRPEPRRNCPRAGLH